MEKADKGWAFIGTLPILGLILSILAKKNKDKYVMFYAKQGLVLGIVWAIGHFVLTILVFTIILNFFWGPIMFVLWILSVINAFSGHEKPTPIIGRFAEKFKF